jgi:hypothetical protein
MKTVKIIKIKNTGCGKKGCRLLYFPIFKLKKAA